MDEKPWTITYEEVEGPEWDPTDRKIVATITPSEYDFYEVSGHKKWSKSNDCEEMRKFLEEMVRDLTSFGLRSARSCATCAHAIHATWDPSLMCGKPGLHTPSIDYTNVCNHWESRYE